MIWGASTGLGTGRVSTAYNQVDFGATVRAGDQFGYSVDALEDVVQNGAVAPHAVHPGYRSAWRGRRQ